MSTTLIIEGNVTLTPSELRENIQELLVSKLNKKYLTCNINYGYVYKILAVHNKYTTLIDNNSSNINFDLKFKIERILPIVNMKLNCTVHTIFNHGIFAQVEDKIKILVPSSTISDYFFQKNQSDSIPASCFCKKDKSSIIKKNDTISIIITDVKYSKNRYNCIGKLSLKR